jgi:hypothetical protein
MRMEWIVGLALAVAAGGARAAGDSRTCDGPPECCPRGVTDHLDHRVTVAVGVAFLGLYNVDDKLGTWEADYYLYEAWPPTPAFVPQTEVLNEVNRQSSQFDETALRGGRCVRSRRIHSTLHAAYNLHAFPFDRQRLVLELGDAEFDDHEVGYEPNPYVLGLDGAAREQLTSWTVEGPPDFQRGKHLFEWEHDSPDYDYARITLPVRRHIGFYLTRFFLPLMLIVMVAFTVFWIDPSDLSSQVGVGVTCLLAVIAFQFAVATNLPAVEYLTIADEVYAVCYFAITLALMESIYTSWLQRRGRGDEAERVDRISRALFPAAVVVSTLGCGWLTYWLRS